MTQDSLKINQNKDGSFAVEWDKNDPSYNFLNNLTQEQIQSIILSLSLMPSLVLSLRLLSLIIKTMALWGWRLWH